MIPIAPLHLYPTTPLLPNTQPTTPLLPNTQPTTAIPPDHATSITVSCSIAAGRSLRRHSFSYNVRMADGAGEAPDFPIGRAREILRLASIAGKETFNTDLEQACKKILVNQKFKNLLKENRTKPEDLRLEYHILKREGKAPSPQELDQCLLTAADIGHLGFLQFFLAERLPISSDVLAVSLNNAAILGHTSFIKFLIDKGGDSITIDALNRTAYFAMSMNNSSLVRLLSESKIIPLDQIKLVVKEAVADDRLSRLAFPSSEGLFSQADKKHLNEALITAIASNRTPEFSLPTTQHLFSHGWRISDDDMDLFVRKAMHVRQFALVKFLLSDGRSLTPLHLKRILYLDYNRRGPEYNEITTFLHSLKKP